MKKILAISLVFVIMLCTTACSAGAKDNAGNNDTAASQQNTAESALVLLNSVWDLYGDDEKFPVAGGDFSEENASMTGPGKYSIEDAAAIDSALGFPAASIDKIDDAASLTHMMNANNFTCGVYHVKDAAAADVANDIKENIANRQWMCGFPERLIIAVSGDYVIAVFGGDSDLSLFNDKLNQAVSNVEIICDNPIE